MTVVCGAEDRTDTTDESNLVLVCFSDGATREKEKAREPREFEMPNSKCSSVRKRAENLDISRRGREAI